MTGCRRLLALLCALGIGRSGAAAAHSASDAYLTLDVLTRPTTAAATVGHGQWDIALRDLDFALSLDANGDGKITWREVAARRADIERYALAGLKLSRGGKHCRLAPSRQLIANHTDGAYAALLFDFSCPSARGDLELDYGLFFSIDPSHRGILTVRAGANVATAVLAPERRHLALGL
jgi:hypothetical protein